MGLFSGVAGATVQGQGVKLPEGTFGVKIKKCHVIRSQNAASKQAGHMLAIQEFEVVHSTHPSAQVGQEFSNVEDMSAQFGPGNMKGFVLAILGVDSKDEALVAQVAPYLDGVLEAAFDGRNLFGPQGAGRDGLIVGVTVVSKTSKENRQYQRHVWFPVPGMPPQTNEVFERLKRAPQAQALPPQAPNAYAQQAQAYPVQQPAPLHQHFAPPTQAPQPQYPPGYGAPQPQQFPGAPVQASGFAPPVYGQQPPMPPQPQQPQWAPPQPQPQQAAPPGAPMPMGLPPGQAWAYPGPQGGQGGR